MPFTFLLQQRNASKKKVVCLTGIFLCTLNSRRVAAKRWQKKQVIEQVWQQELKINDSNFHSILIASKKAKHDALYNAAITYVARNLKRLKSSASFQNLQKEPEILISILEQAKSPRSNYVYNI